MKCAELQELSEKHRFAGSMTKLSRSTGIVTVTSYSLLIEANKLAGRQRGNSKFELTETSEIAAVNCELTEARVNRVLYIPKKSSSN